MTKGVTNIQSRRLTFSPSKKLQGQSALTIQSSKASLIPKRPVEEEKIEVNTKSPFGSPWAGGKASLASI